MHFVHMAEKDSDTSDTADTTDTFDTSYTPSNGDQMSANSTHDMSPVSCSDTADTSVTLTETSVCSEVYPCCFDHQDRLVQPFVSLH